MTTIEIIFIMIMTLAFFSTVFADKKNQTKSSINKQKDELTDDQCFKVKVAFVETIIIIITLIIWCLVKTNSVLSIASILLFILSLLYSLTIILNSFLKNDYNFNSEYKYHNIRVSFLYIIFFFSMFVPVHNQFINSVISNILIKESLILIYIVVKLTSLTYLTILNLAIFASNLEILFPTIMNKPLQIYSSKRVWNMILLPYEKILKNNKQKILFWKLIYILTTPFGLLLTALYILIGKVVIKLFNFFAETINKITKFYQNRNYLIVKTIKAATILSLSITYIVGMCKKDIFCNQGMIVEIYSFFAGTILIPLIYDSIKENKNKKNPA